MVMFCFLTTNAQTKKWTLQECITHAIQHNISVKQSALDVTTATIDKSDAIGGFLPTVNATASNSWNTGLTQNVVTGVLQNQTTRNSSYTLTAGVTLYDGLRNFRTLQRAKMSKIASQYALEKMADDISLAVANGYLQVLTARENYKVIKAQHEITLAQLERTSALVNAGVLPAGDLLEIQATSVDESQRIILAENTIAISRISLAQLLLIKEYKDFDIEDRDYEVPVDAIINKSVEEIIAQSKKERYEIRIAEENAKIAAKDIELAKGAYQPTLNGFFNYNTRESSFGEITSTGIDPNNPTQFVGFVETTNAAVVKPNFLVTQGAPLPFFDQLSNNDGISYGIQLNVPIFSGMATRNAVKRSKINLQRAQYSLEQSKLDLESNIYQAYADAKGAAKAYEAAAVAEDARKQAYQFAKDRYEVGLINSFDFSQAKFSLENAQSELVRTKFDYIFKLKVLELYFGIPVAALKL